MASSKGRGSGSQRGEPGNGGMFPPVQPGGARQDTGGGTRASAGGATGKPASAGGTARPRGSSGNGSGNIDRGLGAGLGGPPMRGRRLDAWLWLAGCVLVALPMLWMHLGRMHVISDSEALVLSASVQSAERYASGAPNPLVPHLNDHAQFDRMPGLYWLHLLALRLASSPGAALEQQVWVLRSVSAVMGVLMLMSVYWAGHAVGAMRTALLAGVLVLCNPLFWYFSRQATAVMPTLALQTLAVAGAVWAIRPFRPAPSVERQFIGWVTCGLGMGAAIMVGGALSLPLVTLVVLMLLVLCPGRISHLLGLLAATLIGVLMVAPWAVLLYEKVDQPWGVWLQPFLADDHASMMTLADNLRRVVLFMLLGMLPWTVWLAGAMAQPFSASSRGSRARLSMGWAWWLAAALVMLAIPARRTVTDLMPLVPAFTLVLALLFNLYADLAAVGRFPRSWRWTRWVMGMLMTSFALVGPLALAAPDTIAQWIGMDNTWIDPVAWYYALGLGLAMLGLSLLAAYWARQHHITRTVVAWAGVVAIALTFVTLPLSTSPHLRNAHADDALTLTQLSDQRQVVWLLPEMRVPPLLVLQARRSIHVHQSHEVSAILADRGVVFVLLPRDHASADANAPGTATTPTASTDRAAGLAVVRQLSLDPRRTTATRAADLPSLQATLWRLDKSQ